MRHRIPSATIIPVLFLMSAVTGCEPAEPGPGEAVVTSTGADASPSLAGSVDSSAVEAVAETAESSPTQASPPRPQGLGEVDGPEPLEEEGPPAPEAEPPAGSAGSTSRGTATVRPLQGTPAITFSKLEHDFGEVFDIRELECEFEFTNTGDGVLLVSNLKPTCGCTTTALEKKVFRPGEGSTIKVNYTPKGYGGRQRNRILVVTNAPEDRVTELSIVAHVTPFVVFTPKFLKLEKVRYGQRHIRTVKVACHDPNFVIESVETSSPHLSARVVDREQIFGPVREGELPASQMVEVTLHESAPWGASYGNVAMHCRARLEPGGEEVQHTAKLLVSATVYGELQADANIFRISVVPPGGSFEKTIRLTRPSGEAFRIMSTEIRDPSMPGITLRVEPVTEEPVVGYDLILSGDAGTYLGPVSGYVDIETDVEGEEQFEIRFAGMVRALKAREMRGR